MTRNIIDIDLDSCIGCHSCAVVCKQENNVGLGTFYNKVLTVGSSGTYPDLEMYYLPVSCQHCDNPECVSVCPTGASYKRDDGVVLVKHCPGQARKFGDLDDPQSDVSKLRAAKKTYKLKDVGNHPGVDYAMDKCAWKGDE